MCRSIAAVPICVASVPNGHSSTDDDVESQVHVTGGDTKTTL